MMNIQEIIEQMKAHINNLNVNEEFLIRDLFYGYKWNRLDKNIRIQLGQIFLNQVNNNLHPQVKPKKMEKKGNNQQKYIKV